MSFIRDYFKARLEKRKEEGTLRILRPESSLVDFCSNDYLGFARSQVLVENIYRMKEKIGVDRYGSTGSRLISGNSVFCEELEDKLAKFHKAETGLIFNSGYDANIGVFSSVAGRSDTILYDALSHASIRDGIRLSLSDSLSFRHNDLNDLSIKLSRAKGRKFVAVESVYSMDGDVAPLKDLVSVCDKFDAALVVDEAHAVGVIGENGVGLVSHLSLNDQIFLRIITFGKALGVHGAIVLGDKISRDYLINFARSFIYTTALPLDALVAIRAAYDLLANSKEQRVNLRRLILKFNLLKESTPINSIPSESAVHALIIPGNSQVRLIADGLERGGFNVKPIFAPTVPRGSERLRVALHAFNTEDELFSFITLLKELCSSYDISEDASSCDLCSSTRAFNN